MITESIAGQPWLSLITFTPLVGALCIMLRRMMSRVGDDGAIAASESAQVDNVARWVALIFTGGAFLVSLGVYALYDPSIAGYQLESGSVRQRHRRKRIWMR